MPLKYSRGICLHISIEEGLAGFFGTLIRCQYRGICSREACQVHVDLSISSNALGHKCQLQGTQERQVTD